MGVCKSRVRMGDSGSKMELRESERALRKLRNVILHGEITREELNQDKINTLDVVIDGLDGSGKTMTHGQLYNLLQESGINVVVIDEGDADPFQTDRKEYKKSSADPLVLFHHKLAGRREAIIRKAQELADPKVRLQERGYGTTLVEFLAASLQNNYSSIKAPLHYSHVRSAVERMSRTYRVPEVHIILDCDPRTAAQRVADRYEREHIRPSSSESEAALKMLRGYYMTAVGYLPNAHLIDTTDMKPEEVTRHCLVLIKSSPKYELIAEKKDQS